MNGIAAALLVLACVVAPVPRADKDAAKLERHVYPLAKPNAAPKVVLDASQVPAQRAWGELAKEIVVDWYPHVTSLLATEDFDSPKQIKLKILPDMPAPAWASGAEISINGKWIAEHPEDFGMVVHELVHVVQGYPDAGAHGWLVEGIADYVRWWKYEPEAPRTTYAKGQTYRDGYRVTAAFLAWATFALDRRVVPALDLALRKGKDPAKAFEDATGRTFEKAWEEYASAAR